MSDREIAKTKLDDAYEKLCAAYRKESRYVFWLILSGVIGTILALVFGVICVWEDHNVVAFLTFALMGADIGVVSYWFKKMVWLKRKQRFAERSYAFVQFLDQLSEDTTSSS